MYATTANAGCPRMSVDVLSLTVSLSLPSFILVLARELTMELASPSKPIEMTRNYNAFTHASAPATATDPCSFAPSLNHIFRTDQL